MINPKLTDLKKIRLNADNPRTITKVKFEKLVDSLLVFPKMLELRPIAIDGTGTALGGNMRLNALKAIAKMQSKELAARLVAIPDYQQHRTREQQRRLSEFWLGWLQKPQAVTTDASELTEDEKREFIAKDNIAYGTWDWDTLADKWDADQLQGWGLDTWGNPEGQTKGDGSETNYSPDDFGEEFTLNDGDKEPFQHMSFLLANEQAECLQAALKEIKQTEEYKYVETFGNENSNGNALYLIIQQWTEHRKS